MGIAVLGPLTIEGESKVLGRRDRVVLAALVVRPGDVVSAGVLADAIWGERPPASAAKVIQGCVVRLRKTLGSHAIETSPLGYRLTMPTDEIDASRFERAVDRARKLLAADDAERSALVLADALALWRGRPLTEVDSWDPGRIEAARLLELRHAAEELYVESALRAGRHDAVLAKAQALVAEAPLRERRWLLLATAQYQAGRQGEALSTLRKLRAVLDRDLGLDPGPEIESLEQAILRQDPALVVPSALPEPSPVCPYPGLASYDVDDADGFFGRDAEIAACLRTLADTSVLAVVGPSGCGKSSLVRAGVAAALRRDGGRVVVMTPGAHPVDALAAAMPGKGPAPALLVDQCEEVFSLCPDAAERDAFLVALAAHAGVAPLVLSFRADRLAAVAAYPGFARVVEQGFYLLAGMAEPELRAAIEEPARLASLVVEPGLVDLLVHEAAGHPGALPLMSHALAETWQRREGRTLTVAGYNASGGISGAVSQSAEDVYASVPADQRAVLRDLLLRLVTPGPEGEPVRSRLPRRLVVTGPEHDAMIDLLVGSRLVTSDDGVVELAHEALAGAWPRLRDWLDDDLDGQRILHHLAVAADSWHTLGRPDSELYRGVRLAKALDWRARASAALTATEQDFLAESKRLSEAELRAAQDRARYQTGVNRRLRAALMAGAFLLVGALIAGFVAVRQADRADAEAAAAQQLAVSADARRVGARAQLSEEISLSLLLAAAGVRLAEAPETRANLLAALARHPRLVRLGACRRRRAQCDGGDARRPLAGLRRRPEPDAPVRHDRQQPGPELLGLPQIRGAGVRLRGIPVRRPTARGRRGDAGPRPGPAARPGDHAGGGLAGLSRPVLPAGSPGFGIFSVRFSADGNRSGRDRAGKSYGGGGPGRRTDPSPWCGIFERVTSHPCVIPLGKGVQVAVLSRDGRTMYTTVPVTAYDVSTGRRIWRRDDLLTWLSIGLSPDESRLVGEYHDFVKDNTMYVVDARTGSDVTRLRAHTAQPRDLRFSNDGTMLASASDDGEVIVWDAKSWQPKQRWRTFEHSWAIDFSPDDRLVYTGGDDGMLRTWDLTAQDSYLHRIAAVAGSPAAAQADLSPDGRTVAYRWLDGEQGWIKFVDTASGVATRPQRMPVREGSFAVGTWRADGRRYASYGGGEGGAVSILDPTTGTVREERRLPVDVHSLAFVDGDRLLVGDSTQRLSVLDANTLRPSGAPRAIPSNCCIAVSPDGRSALVFDDSSDGASERWRFVDVAGGQVRAEGAVPFRVHGSDMSPDGRRVAVTGQTGEVATIDLGTGQLQPGSAGLGGEILRVQYSDDGSHLVTSSVDGAISLWTADSVELLGTVYPPHAAGEPVAATAQFDGGGNDVTIASYDGRVYRWDTSPARALDHACQMAGRNLSAEEWSQFLPDQPFRKICPQFP